jgi:hypothetical protein
MTTKTQFEGSRLKVQRAARHIDELNDLFSEFLKQKFCEIVTEDDPQNGNKIIKVRSVANLPLFAPMIVGDIVHNLRSALDHAMVEILKGTKDVHFPFGKTQKDFENHGTFRWIAKNRPKLADKLKADVVAYETGQPSIWAASKLDNIDKHNLLIGTIVVKKLVGVRIESPNLRTGVAGVDFVFDEGGAVNFANVPGPVTVVDPGTPQAAILFEVEPLRGQPLIPSLIEMQKLTLQTIETLEKFHFAG